MRMQENVGTFVISLDFELYWGVHDVFKREKYEKNIRGAHDAVLAMLETFQKYDIHATWAIVGMIYCTNIMDLKKHIPRHTPTYNNKKLSAYHYVENNPITEQDYDLFFAPYLIQRIRATPNQEIATHTFSHYYTLEKGQSEEQFSSDLKTAIHIAGKNGNNISSIVFPRNQVNEKYLQTCGLLGITAYRGTENSFIYKLNPNERKRFIKRVLRLLDCYMNLFGHHTYSLPSPTNNLVNIKSSRFLRPYSKKRSKLESFRLKRIKNAMTYAAKRGEIYHLWWHPHNFGINLDLNMVLLQEILNHFILLQKTYGFQSRNMRQLASDILANNTSKSNY